jgi:hypothetical protein
VLQQPSSIECTFTTFGFNVLDFDFHNMSNSGPIVEVRFELLETIFRPLSLARNLAISAVTQHVWFKELRTLPSSVFLTKPVKP